MKHIIYVIGGYTLVSFAVIGLGYMLGKVTSACLK